MEGRDSTGLEIRRPEFNISSASWFSYFKNRAIRDFPSGAAVKNPPANAGNTGSSPGPGRSHMPWSN